MISPIIKNILLIIFLLTVNCQLPTAPLFAQSPTNSVWTLQQCIDHALKNNIQIKQNQLGVELSKEKYLQTIAGMLPSLNGSATHNYSYGRTIDIFTNQFINDRTQSNNFSLSSNITLFNGFELQNTRIKSQYDYMSSKFDAEKNINDITLNIVSSYLQILFNQESVDITNKRLDGTKLQRDRTKKIVDAGGLPQGSFLDIEAQVASDELQSVNAQNQLDLSYLNLIQLLDLDSVKNFQIGKPDFSNVNINSVLVNPSEVFATAVKTQPEIKSSEYKMLSAEKGLSVARGAMSPRLTLSGSFGTGYSDNRQRQVGSTLVGYNPIVSTDTAKVFYSPLYIYDYEKTPFRDQLNDNFNKFIGFNLTVPLFNGWQTNASIKRAKISLQNARLNEQLTKNQLNKTIQQSYADAVASYKKYNASQKSVDALKESFKYTEQKFNVGLLNSVDYITAKNNLTKAESDLLQAKYEYIFKTKILDFYQGKPLTF